MIYIIEDMRSRQRDYGWNDNKLSQFKDEITPIFNFEDLLKNKDNILMTDNIILFHESFLASNDNEKLEEIEQFKKSLEDNKNVLYIVYFSGSKNSRFVDERLCMLPPDVMYANLDLFISKMNVGDINLNYLAYGENFSIEEQIKNRLKDVNTQNVGDDKIHVDKDIFFAVTTDDEVEPPFENVDIVNNWDFYENDISDKDLDDFVNQFLQTKQFEAIYIPLYFGNSYSDYMGLRLAMHIRLTESINQFTPIFIYGVSTHEELLNNSCYDILKLSCVCLINADNESLKLSIERTFSTNQGCEEFDKISLNIPSNIGSNHSVANKWAMYRWMEMIKWSPENVPQITDTDFRTSLYFKFLDAKYGKHDKFKQDKKYQMEIPGLQNKRIVYIDDEYDKGWENILRTLFEYNGVKFICFKGFDKKLSKIALIDKIKAFIAENDADCFLLDLRLHEDDFGETKKLTGHEISRFIKERNKGNQIVIFSASNKIWNLKEQIVEIGATAYALKESPDLNLKREGSTQLYIDFIKAVKTACSLSYLKEIVKKQQEVKEIIPSAVQLDSVVNLLSKNAGQKDQDLLGAALLAEIVFIEDYIKNTLGYKLLKTGKEDALRVELCSKDNKQKLLSGHIFVKRAPVGERSTVTDISFYYENKSSEPNGWGNISDSDVILIAAVLLMEFGFSVETIKKYLYFKYVRNTLISHKSIHHKIPESFKRYCQNLNDNNDEIKICESEIVDFYNSVIYPMVMKSSKNNKHDLRNQYQLI